MCWDYLFKCAVNFNTDFVQERMAGIESLSTIVRSLTRDVDESREAAGLLMDLSVIPKVRQRIGRVQGCIVMLVTLFNGGDRRALHDAGKLLIALSSNTQNVLLMAEAGYFVPLVQYLKEGNCEKKLFIICFGHDHFTYLVILLEEGITAV